MELIYQNFDKLELSFKGSLPLSVLEDLADAKKRAQDEKLEEVLSQIGKENLKVMVLPNGMKGGYAYVFHTGSTGAIWAIKNDSRANQWNIRISIRSLNLAINGYYEVKQDILKTLKNLDANLSPRINPKTGKIISEYEETISRVDYCFDFMSENFCPDPSNLIRHSHTKIKTHEKDEQLLNNVMQGNRYITITAGCMPNKQIQIYDKTKEVLEKRKNCWYKIWDIKNFSSKQKVWRIEVRLGKDYLSKTLKLKTFNELENKLPKILQNVLTQTRYIKPSHTDNNITRAPTEIFWKKCINESTNCIKSKPKIHSEETVKELLLMQKIETYENLILGNTIAYASAIGLSFEKLPECIKTVSEKNIKTLKCNIETYKKRFLKAQERLSLV